MGGSAGCGSEDADGHVVVGLTTDMAIGFERVVRRVRDRSLRWLRKRGLLDERLAEERGNEQPPRSALDTCAEVALRGGAFAVLEPRGASRSEGEGARFEPRKRGPFTAERDGFNLQAAVRIEADNDEGRERLVRYCARPCFALERLRGLRDGRVAYRVKYGRPRRHAPRDDAYRALGEAFRAGASAEVSAREIPRRPRGARHVA